MNMESVGNLDWSTRENELLKFIRKHHTIKLSQIFLVEEIFENTSQNLRESKNPNFRQIKLKKIMIY